MLSLSLQESRLDDGFSQGKSTQLYCPDAHRVESKSNVGASFYHPLFFSTELYEYMSTCESLFCSVEDPSFMCFATTDCSIRLRRFFQSVAFHYPAAAVVIHF